MSDREKKASGCQFLSVYWSSDAPIAVGEASTVILVVAACFGWTRSVAVAQAVFVAQKALVIAFIHVRDFNSSTFQGVVERVREVGNVRNETGVKRSACPKTPAVPSYLLAQGTD